jgi:hypothetical protein
VDAPDEPRRASARLVVLLGAVAAGVVLVVARFVTGSPLWLDEALSVHISRLPMGDIPEALRHDGHPPLYYWLLHLWMDAFGEGDVAVRALSGIAGVAALPLVWFAGRRIGGTRTAWCATLLLAASPFAVRYATETRMYALVTLLVLVGHLVVRRAVDEQQVTWPRLVGLGLLSGTLLLTQYWTAFLIATTVLLLVVHARRAGGAGRRVAIRLAGAIAAGGLLFLPWLPSFLAQAAHTGTPWATAPRPTVVFDMTLRDFGGGTVAEAGLLAAALVVLLVFGTFGRSTPQGLAIDLRMVPAARGEAVVAVGALALGSLAGLATNSTFASRYASIVLPLVVLVAGRGLAVVPGRRAVALTATLVAGLGMAGIVNNVTEDRTQAGSIASRIAATAGPDDLVVTCPDQLGPALRRALDHEGRPDLPVLGYPTLDDGERVDWYDYEQRNDAAVPTEVAEEIVGRVPEDARTWVVWNGAYRTFEGDCEALLNTLSRDLGPFQVAIPDGADRYFEHAALVVFAERA